MKIILQNLTVAHLVMIVVGCATGKTHFAPCPRDATPRTQFSMLGFERFCTQEFQEGVFKHGPYALYNDDGDLLTYAYYYGGDKSGPVYEYWLNGQTKSIQNLKGGIPHGSHTSWDENGTLLSQADYWNGKTHGDWNEWYPSGARKIRGYSIHGVRDGTWQHWYSNGGFAVRERFKEDLLNGERTSWHPNGEIQSEGRYLEGRPIGEWKIWDKNGELISSENYSKENEWRCFDGSEKSGASYPMALEVRCKSGLRTEWHPTGAKKLEGKFLDTGPEGAITEWDENGTKVKEAHYKNGQLHGPRRVWHSNTRIAEEGQYTKSVPSGTWRFWADTDVLLATYKYEDGLKSGVSTYWWHTEKKRLEIHVRTENLVRAETFDIDGKRIKLEEHNSASQMLNVTSWHPGGVKKFQGSILSGSPHGEWSLWNSSGRKIRAMAFDHGNLVQDQVSIPGSPKEVTPAASEFLISPRPSEQLNDLVTSREPVIKYWPIMVAGVGTWIAANSLFPSGENLFVQGVASLMLALPFSASAGYYIYEKISDWPEKDISEVLEFQPVTPEQMIWKEKRARQLIDNLSGINKVLRYGAFGANLYFNLVIFSALSKAGPCKGCEPFIVGAMGLSTIPLFFPATVEQIASDVAINRQKIYSPEVNVSVIPTHESPVWVTSVKWVF